MASYTDYDFKFAKTILSQPFPDLQLSGPLGRGVRPPPAQRLQRLLERKGWPPEPPVAPGHPHLRLDRMKGKVAVEIQLSDPADCYNFGRLG